MRFLELRRVPLRRALTMVAVSALAFGAVGVADAGKGKGKRVKTKLVKVEIGPDGASGKVKSKKKACVKGRNVTLKGPKPFDPRAGRGAAAAGGMVKIGSDRTNAKGHWDFTPRADGFFVAGIYNVRVVAKRAKAEGENYLCEVIAYTIKA